MPKIKAFSGIHPSPETAAEVVLQIEDLSLDMARSIRKSNPLSYVNMLVPKIESPYQRGSRREIAFKKINENLEAFLERNILIKDAHPSVYIYQIRNSRYSQTGIWTTTAIDDYLDNTVKKHELTRAEREKNLVEYLQQTGIDANPVLITYYPRQQISNIIEEAVKQTPVLDFTIAAEEHLLWRIENEDDVTALTAQFAALGNAYIADGHHRAAAACSYGIERRKHNLKHRGDEEYNFFASVYMPADQVKIFEFNRLVKDTGDLGREAFMKSLEANFSITSLENKADMKPVKPHRFGMYIAGCAYMLEALEHTHSSLNPVKELDVSILQDYILEPVLNISDPRTDQRLSFTGGLLPLEELLEKVDSGAYAVAFILYPTSVEQLVKVADAGEVMPPKSTWFEPKFRSGLLIHEVN